uniref:Uncharacterized protein n=1 Tax=Ananas comosus var. bracteatus TaxID=296719 RepID=A0A6V7QVH5_ANACO
MAKNNSELTIQSFHQMASLQLALEDEEEKAKAPNYAQAFIAQRGRGGRGRNNGGRNFNSRGRGFVQSGTYNNQGGRNNRNFFTNNTPQSQQENFQRKNQQQPNQGELSCQICGISGHIALKCFYRFDHAYQSEDLPQAFAAMSLPNDKDPTFYADTAATAHMTSDPGILHSKYPYHDKTKVYTGDGTALSITHTGSASIGSVKLNNVLVVPELKKNLLSVSQFTEENPSVFVFSSTGFVIKDLVTQKILTKGTKKEKLYALEEGEEYALAVLKAGKAEDSIWHCRLGHPHSRILQTLASNNVIIKVSKIFDIPYPTRTLSGHESDPNRTR